MILALAIDLRTLLGVVACGAQEESVYRPGLPLCVMPIFHLPEENEVAVVDGAASGPTGGLLANPVPGATAHVALSLLHHDSDLSESD